MTTLRKKGPQKLFEGNVLLRRLVRIGVFNENKVKLLGLKDGDFLERRH